MIGIFDSGLGGLTVVKALQRRLPEHDFTYFGDTARTPYGPKGEAVIRRFGVEDARFLVSKGAKAIIVACHTVSAVAIKEVRQAVRVPVFEVITPSIAKAVRLTRRRVGVIGTRGTIDSGAYSRLMAEAAIGVRVTEVACPLFVPLVEEGWAHRTEAVAIIQSSLKPIRDKKVDTLILGCTHYPFLKNAIAAALPKDVHIVDPAGEAVEEFARYLSDHPQVDAGFGKNASQRFYVSDPTEHAQAIASKWMGKPILLERAVAEHAMQS